MKTILVALDGSPRAEHVLATAIAVARTQGRRLVLMRAIGLVGDIPKDLWHTTDEPLIDVLHQRAQDYLARCEARPAFQKALTAQLASFTGPAPSFAD